MLNTIGRVRLSPRHGSSESQDRLTQKSFEVLLASLDGDRERAGCRYESIRRKLLLFFERRNSEQADRCADEVMDRAAMKIYGGAIVPDVERYCYGIARVLVMEGTTTLRKRREAFRHLTSALAASGGADEIEEHLTRLDFALQALSSSERELILAYYESVDRVSARRALAERYGIPLNALRIRAHRIRVKLQAHIYSLTVAEEGKVSVSPLVRWRYINHTGEPKGRAGCLSSMSCPQTSA